MTSVAAELVDQTTTLLGYRVPIDAGAGSSVLNQLIKREPDRLMPRTRNRPLVTGVIAPRDALVFENRVEVLDA